MILRKQRVLAFLLCILLALACFSVPMLQGNVSHAAEPTFEVTANPANLSAPGKVTLTFKVTNPDGSASPLKNAKVLRSDGSTVASFAATVNNNDSKTYEANITQNLLGQPISYTLSYEKEGSTKKVDKSITIGTAGGGTGSMTVSSQPQNANLVGSNKTSINYTVTNTGTAAITNIRVTDKDIAGSKNVGTIDSLAAGASKNFSYEATFTRNSVSEPVATGSSGGKTITATGAKKTITVGGAALTAELAADKNTTGEGPVNFTLKLSNGGSTPITGAKVTDATGESYKDNITIPAGGNIEVTFSKEFSSEIEFYVIVTGKDGSGAEVKTESNKIAIGAGEDDLIDPANGISLTLTANKDQLEKPDKIQLTMDIENLLKDQGYSDITITDKATRKELQKIERLEPSEMKHLESEVDIREDTTFIYIITATADDGAKLELESNTLEIKVGDGNRNNNFILFLIIFLVVLVILIGVVIALVVISRKNKKKKAAGTPYSKKFRKKKDREALDEEFDDQPPAPASTFTMDPEQDTLPINIPNQSSNFRTMDYDALEEPEEPYYDPNAPLDQVMGQEQSDETRPLGRPFQTIDYDDLDPDKQ